MNSLPAFARRQQNGFAGVGHGRFGSPISVRHAVTIFLKFCAQFSAVFLSLPWMQKASISALTCPA